MKTNKEDYDGHIVTQPYALCWLCTSSNRKNNMILIFSIEGKKEHLCEKISMYTPFKVEVCSSLSAILCKACVLNINNWHGFIEYCIKAQQDLKATTGVPSSNGTEECLTRNSTVSSATYSEPVNLFPIDTKNCLFSPAIAEERNNAVSQVVSSCSEVHPVLPTSENGGGTVSLIANVQPESLPICTAVLDNVTAYVPSAVATATQGVMSTEQSQLPTATPLVVLPSSTANPNKPLLKPQGTYCCAKWCRNNAGEHPNLSCFRVPKNKARAEQWLKNAGREDLLQEDSSKLHTKYLCQEHFTKNMFTNSNCNRLVWNAVPTLFPRPKALTTYVLDVPQAPLQVFQPPPVKIKRKLLPKTTVRSKASRTPSVSSGNFKYILPAPTKKSEDMTFHRNVSVLPSKTKSGPSEMTKSKVKDVPALEDGDASLATEIQDSLMTEANQSFITSEVDLPSLESSEPKYTCTFCGEMFLMRSSLIMHQTTYHPDHRVGCELCGQVEYHSRAEFLEHVCVGTNTNT
ncbi:uncharacterized protein [Anabrus simplex]|uniref:uncharacterized protein n=1 Tax=Anabrus simplex TaxID=316456 RepID=UPI0035A34399